MKLQNSHQHKNYQIAKLITLSLAVVIAVFIVLLGKIDSFMFINSRHSEFFDLFFKYATYMGDGMVWVPVIFYFIFLKREFLVSVILAVIISTILSQFLKRVVFPEELRPFSLLMQNINVHFVDGVKVNQYYSFPSGHSTSAFTIALILSFIIDKKSWSIVLPILALVAGYSRVYLAQHFVVDVLAGMLLALLTVHLSIKISEIITRRFSKQKS